jgi:hypothetical protein
MANPDGWLHHLRERRDASLSWGISLPIIRANLATIEHWNVLLEFPPFGESRAPF